MIAIALTLAAMAAAAAVALRRRRARRSSGLSPALDPLPAGLKHLVTEVSDLSDRGLHLAAARRSALSRKPRLGVLLGLR
jgi:hypothetical protein